MQEKNAENLAKIAGLRSSFLLAKAAFVSRHGYLEVASSACEGVV